MHADPHSAVELELIVTSDPDAPQRIVRIASTVPYTIVSMWLGPSRAGLRSMRMMVAGEGLGFETLRKRLNRVIDVVKVRILP